MHSIELTDREKSILRHVVQQFILTASPVGSRNISKRYNIGLSPASIRNIMADLEETGYLNHPHTSAGRIPTDMGYRFYVDSLMDPPTLNEEAIKKIDSTLEAGHTETNELIELTSILLSELTNQLACITFPKFDNAVLEKIQLVQLSINRILVVLTVKSGLVRTITLEITKEATLINLQSIQQILNERLSGLKFTEIRKTFSERLKDYNRDELKPIVRLFIDSVDKIFASMPEKNKAVISGATNVLKQPEFEIHQNFQGIIELIENKNVVIHLMEKGFKAEHVPINIKIGSENMDEQFSDFSLITKEYKFGEVSGTVGIIGPKRMEYSKVVAAVMYVAESLSNELKKVNY
ncbi:MAG: heat-inducible transcription repressor HrcA [Ignavibacteriae bacterium HGW-Ignavibacteriae-2]|jgi:heat-inducible transcriptional repressor|nr:MAG: heat-inducible transcription repressor HrcA [Ignavibacteriae bacterium HGW-Ignavibacteriae-2]